MNTLHRPAADGYLSGLGSAVARTTAVCIALAGWPVSLPAHSNHHVAQLVPLSAESSASHANPTPAFAAEARLSVTITDAKLGDPTPARVRITDQDGKPLGLPMSAALPLGHEARLADPGSVIGLPADAIGILYGSPWGYAFQQDGSFYVNGSFDLPMPPGNFVITITKGYEFIREREPITLKPGDHLKRSYALRRWIDMPAQGWYSADAHIHLRRSPRENPLILAWTAAEDIHVGVLLQMGDFWTGGYSAQYGWGRKGLYRVENHMLTSGQEDPRTSYLGHTISFGADQFVRFRDEYYAYDKVFDRIHALGGVSGYAHQALASAGHRGLTLDVLTGKVDFLELMQFCVPQGPLAVEHYYRFLDLGCKLTALAGSDFPSCGRGRRPGEEQVGSQIGDARFYTYTGGPFSFDRWFDGVKAGHTFATSGPMLKLTVNDRLPGSSIDVKPETKLRISATAYGHPSEIPLQRLQIIGHGKVLAEVQPGAPGLSAEHLTIELEISPPHGIWIAARADAGVAQAAHTTPVYITVGGDGFHNRSNLESQIEIARRHLQQIRASLSPRPARDGAPPSDLPAGSRVQLVPGPLSYPGAAAHLEKRIAEAERNLEELSQRR